jgi:hypothetical protein
MIKKAILLLLICNLTLQIFPIQWLTMLVDGGNTIALFAMSDADEDADDETSKEKKAKIFECDFVLLNTNETCANQLKCTRKMDASDSSHCREVICPPPNFI